MAILRLLEFIKIIEGCQLLELSHYFLDELDRKDTVTKLYLLTE